MSRRVVLAALVVGSITSAFTSAQAAVLPGGDFETPEQGAAGANGGFSYNPTQTGGFTFFGTSGIAEEGGGFTPGNTSSGDQAALLQLNTGQTGVTGGNGTPGRITSPSFTLTGGILNTLTFTEARRGGQVNPYDVILDSNGNNVFDASTGDLLLADNRQAPGNTFTGVSIPFTAPTTGQYTLVFLAQGPTTSDNTVFLDDIAIDTVVPEPTGLAAVAVVGALATLRRRRSVR